MKKKFSFGWLSSLLAVLIVFCSGCGDSVFNNGAETKTQILVKGSDNVIVNRTDSVVVIVVNGDTVARFPLALPTGYVTPNDTIAVKNNSVSHVMFDSNKTTTSVDGRKFTAQTSSGEEYSVQVKEKRRPFEDKYNLFTKNGGIRWEDAIVKFREEIYEINIEKDVDCEWINFTSSVVGNQGGYEYTLVTARYVPKYNGKRLIPFTGLKTLRVQKDDELVGKPKATNDFRVVSHVGNVVTGMSTTIFDYDMTVSGHHRDTVSCLVTATHEAQAREVKILSSFELKQKAQSLGSSSKTGEEKDGIFRKENYRRTQTIGNDQFTRVVTYTWQKPFVTFMGYEYAMLGPEFESISDNGFTLEAMSELSGYDRKLYKHATSARYYTEPVSNVSEMELRVKQQKDEMTSRTVVEDGIDWVRDGVTRPWVKVKEVWTVSGTKTYTKSVETYHSIEAPAKVTKTIDNWNVAKVTPVPGTKQFVSQRTEGDFIVKKYKQLYTAGNNKVKFAFTLYHEEATYNPLNFAMKFADYNITNDAYTLTPLSDVQNGGNTYERKNCVETISGTILNHSVSASAEAELWVKKEVEERDTPHWLGDAIGALYSRVPDMNYQLYGAENSCFVDMIVFEYQHGLVVAVDGEVKRLSNGQLDSRFIYAFDATDAARYGVQQCTHSDKNNAQGSFYKYSAVWYNGVLTPSTITISGPDWIWTGKGMAANAPLCVRADQATIMGIGAYSRTPVPTSQKVSIVDGRITIEYSKNNGKTTNDTSLDLK